jgi:hypothetical protein
MASPIFPSVEQVLDILMSEIPDGPYAKDRADDPDPDNRSYSSVELRAHSQMIANAYSNLQDVYSNKFITTVTPDGLADWEKDLFASAQDSNLPFSTRQQNLIAKIRAQGGISLPAIQNVISAILTPLGLPFQILPYGGEYNGTQYGVWVFEYSELGLDTYLGDLDPVIGARRDMTPLDCALNYEAAGLTAQQLAEIQATAYTYEVQIYGDASAATLALLDKQLTAQEPARSTHIITNNATPPSA